MATFDPQPHAVIVDDLLTALTGGHVREAIRFRQDTFTYALKHPLDESRLAFVKVVGERMGSFYLFERGKDYDVAAGAIAWRNTGGKLPDVDSTFYVNYYEVGRSSPLTDRFVGSITRTLAEAFALEVALLQQAIKAAYDTGFVDTATGGALDQVVAILGLKRRSAQYATGEVTFTRAPGVVGDIEIGAGTRLRTATEPPRLFETTVAKTLRDGQLSIAVPIRATVAGQNGIAQPGEITVMVRPIAGIASVTNSEGTAQGRAAETDEELRARAKQAVGQAGRATPAAIRNALLGVPGVRSVELREDLPHEPGQVQLTVDCAETAVGEALAALEANRAAGVRFVHNLIQPEEAGGEAAVTLIAIPAEVRLWVSLNDPGAPQETVARILTAAREAISAYLDGLKVAEALAYNKLMSLAMGVTGVADVAELRIRRLDTMPPQELGAGQSLAAGAGRKITVAASALSVEIAGAPVFLDVTVQYSATAASAGDPARATRTLLLTYLDGVTGTIGLTEIWRALVSAGHIPARVEITAEYSASGASVTRALTDGAATPAPANQFKLAANERAVLRSVAANVTG
ncbi:MAG: baseplate J/gp47 family protein [Anaerolineae bacterium]|nr:baseplate J/gp47 family protein [Anaerolineae bacterium]MDW8099651.1 baseplate J/gp47 family protein [Anaerolineae bacterium]